MFFREREGLGITFTHSIANHDSSHCWGIVVKLAVHQHAVFLLAPPPYHDTLLNLALERFREAPHHRELVLRYFASVIFKCMLHECILRMVLRAFHVMKVLLATNENGSTSLTCRDRFCPWLPLSDRFDSLFIRF